MPSTCRAGCRRRTVCSRSTSCAARRAARWPSWSGSGALAQRHRTAHDRPGAAPPSARSPRCRRRRGPACRPMPMASMPGCARNPLPVQYGALEITKFKPWTPLDGAIIGKALAFSLSFDIDTGPTAGLPDVCREARAATGAGDVLRRRLPLGAVRQGLERPGCDGRSTVPGRFVQDQRSGRGREVLVGCRRRDCRRRRRRSTRRSSGGCATCVDAMKPCRSSRTR